MCRCISKAVDLKHHGMIYSKRNTTGAGSSISIHFNSFLKCSLTVDHTPTSATGLCVHRGVVALALTGKRQQASRRHTSSAQLMSFSLSTRHWACAPARVYERCAGREGATGSLHSPQHSKTVESSFIMVSSGWNVSGIGREEGNGCSAGSGAI